MAEPVLSVRDLTVEIPTRHAVLRPVDAVKFDIAAGEILGVVGESGAGKSMTGNAVIGLLDRPAHIAGGEIWLDGKRIDQLEGEALRHLRGKRIGMVFQDPLTSLNPLLTIGEQLTETIQAASGCFRAEALQRAINGSERSRHSRCRTTHRRLPAPVFRRHAPAGRDCARALCSNPR